MNMHPKAFERAYPGGAGVWLDEPTYKAVADIFNAYHGPGYKGNATAAIAAVLAAAKKAGAPCSIPCPDYLAGWIVTVARSLAWYDPTVLPEEEQKRLRLEVSKIRQGVGVAEVYQGG